MASITRLLSGPTRFTNGYPVVQPLRWRNSCMISTIPSSHPPSSTTLTFTRPRLLPPPNCSRRHYWTAKTPVKPVPDLDIRPKNPIPIWNALKLRVADATAGLTFVRFATVVFASVFIGFLVELAELGFIYHWKVASYSMSPLGIMFGVECFALGLLLSCKKMSVLKLQVGLSGMAKSLRRDLNQIAKTNDTSATKGMSNVLTETTIALLRHPSCCISAYSHTDIKWTFDEGETLYNQLLIEERTKFNIHGGKSQLHFWQRRPNGPSTYGDMVVTILVAAEKVHRLPIIKESKDLNDALQKLGCIPSIRTRSVDVLWTPQAENDTLSEQELLEEYPLLKPL